MREYIPLYGPKGIVVKIRSAHIWIGGSNHWTHWLHHILPGARRREIDCGIEIAEIIEREGIMDIRGLSVGGCIAQIAASVVPQDVFTLRVMTYGTKRAPRGFSYPGKHYRHRGDFVPFLPPWRPRIECEVIGEWAPFWSAHNPKTYREIL